MAKRKTDLQVEDWGQENFEKLLYGEGALQRFTQDSPVLPEVWMEYARAPDTRQDLLLTPFQSAKQQSQSPTDLATELRERLKADQNIKVRGFRHSPDDENDDTPRLAYNHTTVVLRLYFDELVRIVLPISSWWRERVLDAGLGKLFRDLESRAGRKKVADILAGKMKLPQSAPKKLSDRKRARRLALGEDVKWMVAVVGTIVLLNEARQKRTKQAQLAACRAVCQPPPYVPEARNDRPSADERRARDTLARYYEIRLEAIWRVIGAAEWLPEPPKLVYLVSLNRTAKLGVWLSRAAIKADAAHRVFEISCSRLCWAVLDSGIDARHPAFRRRDLVEVDEGREPQEVLRSVDDEFAENSRVKATYDFTLVRRLLSADPAAWRQLPPPVQRRMREHPEEVKAFRERLLNGMSVDWKLLSRVIEIPHDTNYRPPTNEHGTHVAGILGADWRPGEEDDNDPLGQPVQGVCPDINLLDLRVFDDEGKGDEFSIMAAMQYLRYLNSQLEFQAVHGANLSMQIPHKVRNYACGRTPICDECERLVDARLVVVVAAGNRGYDFEPGEVDGRYRLCSITDPGNAEGVITVGSTHRNAPHTYGVSFFSSRGPTGDGRAKPDLVAPGEKIESCVPGNRLKRMDGTSQAAPHVSGAAAQLMARHEELIGQPARIKQILCRTATDLGRTRDFQGAGMLDALRALQSI
ncbi:MAG: S8 family peptidase [Pirellulales bacterium]